MTDTYEPKYDEWWDSIAGKRENCQHGTELWERAKRISYPTWQTLEERDRLNPEAKAAREYQDGYNTLDGWLARGNKLVGPITDKDEPFTRGFNARYEEELAKNA